MNLNVQLSDSFQLSALVRSATADANKIIEQYNVPFFVVNNLFNLCEYFLEPLQKQLGKIEVTSGYRCSKVNSLVNGSKNSQHMKGEAVDIVPPGLFDREKKLSELWHVLLAWNIDQAIRYDNFIHVSWKFSGNRQQYLDYRQAKQ